jgi:pyrroline-5-carboxylate reductase
MNDLQERLGKVALIGGGQMGEAIVQGLIVGASFNPSGIAVAEPFEERRKILSELYGIQCVEDGAMLDAPDTVIMAVKPQIFREVCQSLAQAEGFSPQRVISIAAGVSTSVMLEYFTDCAVVRVMPNINLMVSAGMSVVAPAAGTSLAEAELVIELFGLMGQATLIEESLIDAATAISGSGPAYFALLVEELVKSAIQVGLPEATAELLARQTVIGTGRYLEQRQATTPLELRTAVTSPGGTTEAAIECFEAQGFSLVVQNAINACLRRALELG